MTLRSFKDEFIWLVVGDAFIRNLGAMGLSVTDSFTLLSWVLELSVLFRLDVRGFTVGPRFLLPLVDFFVDLFVFSSDWLKASWPSEQGLLGAELARKLVICVCIIAVEVLTDMTVNEGDHTLDPRFVIFLC